MKRYPINRFKKFDDKLSFIDDLNRENVQVIPRVIIKDVYRYYYDSDALPNLVGDETVDLHFSDRAFIINGNRYIPIIESKGISFSQKVDIDTRQFNTSKLKINLINNIDFTTNDKFTDIMSNIDSLSHKEIHLYLDTSKTIDSYIDGEAENISMLVFKGRISNITHNTSSVTIDAEDNTETGLKRMFPPDANLLPNDESIQDKYRGEVIPLLYGTVEKAPTVIQNGVVKASSENLYFLVAPYGHAPYDYTNGFTYTINYEGLSNWVTSYEELVQHPVFSVNSKNSRSPLLIKTSSHTKEVLFEVEEHMNNTIEALNMFRNDKGGYYHNSLNTTSDNFVNGIKQYDVINVEKKGWAKLNRNEGLFAHNALQVRAVSKCSEISLKHRSPYQAHNGDDVATGYNANPERFNPEITKRLSSLNPGEVVQISDYNGFTHYPTYTYQYDSGWPAENPNFDQVMQSIARLRFSVNPSFSYISMSMNNLKFALNQIIFPKLKGEGYNINGSGYNDHIYFWGTHLNLGAYEDIYYSSKYLYQYNHFRLDMNFSTGVAEYLNSDDAPGADSNASSYPHSTEWDWPLETGQMNELFDLGAWESSQAPYDSQSLRFNTSLGFTNLYDGTGTAYDQLVRASLNPYHPAQDIEDFSGNTFIWGMPYLHLVNEQRNNKSIDIILGYMWMTDAKFSTTNSSYLFDLNGHFSGADFQNIYDIGDVQDADYYLAVGNNISSQIDIIADISSKAAFEYQDDETSMGYNENASGDYNYTKMVFSTLSQSQFDAGAFEPKFDFSINKRMTVKKIFSEISKNCIMGLTPNIKAGKLSFSCILNEYSPWFVYDPEAYGLEDPVVGFPATQNKLLADQVININNLDIIKCNFTKTPYNKVYSKVKVKYNYDYTSDNYSAETETTNYNQMSALNLKLYNYDDVEQNVLEIESKYIRRKTEADLLSQFYYQYYKNQHLIVKLRLPLQYASAQIGMILQFHELVNGKTAHGIDYTKASNPTLKAFIADRRANDQRTTQWIYPFFYINSVKLNLDYVEIEAVQLHYLHSFTEIQLGDPVVAPINEMDTFIEKGLIEEDSLAAFDRAFGSASSTQGWGPVLPEQDEDDTVSEPPTDTDTAIYGCTIHWAQNYQPNATVDNYNCVFTDTGTNQQEGNDIFLYPGKEAWDIKAEYFENITMDDLGKSAISPQEGIIGMGYAFTNVINEEKLVCCLHWEEGGNNFGGIGDGTEPYGDFDIPIDTWPSIVMHGGQGFPWDDENSGFNYMFGKQRWGYFNRELANEILEQIYAELYLEEGDEIPLDWNSESFFWSSDQYQEYLSFNYIEDWNDLLPPHFLENGGITTNNNIDYIALRIVHTQRGRAGGFFLNTQSNLHESIFQWTLKNTATVGEPITLEWEYQFLGSDNYTVGIDSAYLVQDGDNQSQGAEVSESWVSIENHTDYFIHWDGVFQKRNNLADRGTMSSWQSSMGPHMRPNPEGTYNNPEGDSSDSSEWAGPSNNFMIGRGDVNFDSNVDVLDVVLAVQIILGNTDVMLDEYGNLDINTQMQADVNNDGSLNVLDVVTLVNYILWENVEEGD